MKPSIGRIVHFVTKDDEDKVIHRPMIITNVYDSGAVTGIVFLDPYNDRVAPAPNGGFVHTLDIYCVRQDEEHKQPGTWHWAEREE